MAGSAMPRRRRLIFSRIFGAPQLGFLAQLNDQGLDLEGQAIGLPIRTTGSISEPY
jgi:hypothetical protein